MKNAIIIGLLLWGFSLSAQAQRKEKGLLSFDAGLMFADAYSISLGGHYMPCPYVGVGGNFGYWQTMPDGGLMQHVEPGDKDERLLRVFVSPSIVTFTPSLVQTKKMALNFGGEFACMLNRRFYGRASSHNTSEGDVSLTYHSRIAALEGKLWANIKAGHASIGVGYSLSNLELEKAIDREGTHLKNKLSHGIFLRLGYAF